MPRGLTPPSGAVFSMSRGRSPRCFAANKQIARRCCRARAGTCWNRGRREGPHLSRCAAPPAARRLTTCLPRNLRYVSNTAHRQLTSRNVRPPPRITYHAEFFALHLNLRESEDE